MQAWRLCLLSTILPGYIRTHPNTSTFFYNVCPVLMMLQMLYLQQYEADKPQTQT